MITRYNKLPKFSLKFECAIAGLYLIITEFTPNSCQSKAQGLCPGDWTLSHYSGTCVAAYSNLVDQSTARSQCKSLEADLVTILFSDINIFLHDYLKTKGDVRGVWIGLRRQSGKFRWLDSNDQTAYFNWFTEDSESSREDCVQINKKEAKDQKAWTDGDCNLYAGYICEKLQSQRCPYGWIWSDSSRTCIKLFLNELNWNNARDICKSNQGDLLVIKDEKMNIFLNKVLGDRKYKYWIGLNDRKTKNVYRWLDNDEEAQYVKMNLLLLNNGNCGHVRWPWIGWSLNDCGQRMKFICERVTEKNGITQTVTVAGHQNHTESPVHKKNWTQSAAGGGIFFNESAFENSTVSAEVERNGTLSDEDVPGDPQTLVAYLSALVFSVIVLAFFLIPLCLRKNDDLEVDPSQEYEPEQFGDFELDNGVSYYWEEEIRSGDFWQEDFTTNDGSLSSVYFPYWQD